VFVEDRNKTALIYVFENEARSLAPKKDRRSCADSAGDCLGTYVEQPTSEDGRMSEAEAVRRAQQGDAAAFEQLYRLHSRKVFVLCLRMAASPAEAEELMQDAFLQSFRKIQTFRGDSAFSTWLYRLTVNVVLMRCRKKRIVTYSMDEATEANGESETASFEIGERDLNLAGVIDRLTLKRAVAQLPAGYRTVFILHDVQGYAHDEIARILGSSSGNSKSQLNRARARLREILQRSLRRDSRRKHRVRTTTDGSATANAWQPSIAPKPDLAT
jgi:RNA polymerase sigma-70 factor, ECF subfamily